MPQVVVALGTVFQKFDIFPLGLVDCFVEVRDGVVVLLKGVVAAAQPVEDTGVFGVEVELVGPLEVLNGIAHLIVLQFRLSQVEPSAGVLGVQVNRLLKVLDCKRMVSHGLVHQTTLQVYCLVILTQLHHTSEILQRFCEVVGSIEQHGQMEPTLDESFLNLQRVEVHFDCSRYLRRNFRRDLAHFILLYLFQ